MVDIKHAEISDSQQDVTGDMVEDAANVLANHYVTCKALYTGIICCACGERSQNMKEWREHVAEIILIRHTAILKRKTMQHNPNMSQQPLNPPTLHETGNLLLASSGFYIRLNEDGSASLMDGIQNITLADFTSPEIEDIAYNLSNKIGATR